MPDKPAEVYVDDGQTKLLATDLHIQNGWAAVKELEADRWTYYPAHLVHHIHGRAAGPPQPTAPRESEHEGDGASDEGQGSGMTPASRLAAHLTTEGFSLESMSIAEENGELVIDTSRDGFEATDEWQEWTKRSFGRGRVGSIDWKILNEGTENEQPIPQAFRLPVDKLDEVVG